MKLNIHEILTLVNDAKTYQERLDLIQKHQSLVLEQILQYNFHPDLEFALPPGDAPFKRDEGIPIGKSPTNLYQEGRRLYIFLKGEAPNVTRVKRENIYIQMLEGLHFTEADILQAVKDKKLQELFPNVTYKLAFDSFERLVPPPVEEVEVEVPAPVVVEQKAEVTPVDSPLEQPVPKAKKPKREMTDKWRASLERAQAARKAKAEAARAEKAAQA